MIIPDAIRSTLSQALVTLDNAYGDQDEIDAARDWLDNFEVE